MADRAVLLGHLFLEGFHEVLCQMKTVCHLQRVRQRLANRLGEGRRAVATDNLNAGMVREPLLDGSSFAVWQEIDRLASFQINQDRAIAVSSAKREVVDAQRMRGGDRTAFVGGAS